jgi:hypothetical protein
MMGVDHGLSPSAKLATIVHTRPRGTHWISFRKGPGSSCRRSMAPEVNRTDGFRGKSVLRQCAVVSDP